MRLINLLNERHEDRVAALSQYVDRDDVFVHFSNVPKLGINPATRYDTPAGIYAYPLKEMFQKIADDNIPFAGDRKFIVVFEASGVTDLSRYSDADWERDKERLRSIMRGPVSNAIRSTFTTTHEYHSRYCRTLVRDLLIADDEAAPFFKRDIGWVHLGILNGTVDLDDIGPISATTREGISQAGDLFLHPEKHPVSVQEYEFHWKRIVVDSEEYAKPPEPCGFMWNTTRRLALWLANRTGRKSAAYWTGILRSLGYDGFTDRTGLGLIHDNEPVQAVFFGTQPLRLLEIIPNVRRMNGRRIRD